jgi:hypothetical protein
MMSRVFSIQSDIRGISSNMPFTPKKHENETKEKPIQTLYAQIKQVEMK